MPNSIKAIVLDSETTGLRAPEPCEIAYIALKELTHYSAESIIRDKHTMYLQRFKPSKPIEAGAKAVHGISDSDVADCPPFTLTALGLEDSVEYLICHNVSYDFRVLGKPENRFKKICTVKLAKQLWPELPSHKLTVIVETFFPDIAKQLTVGAHGALVDSKLCLLILAKALEEFELNSWADIYEIAGQK